jgi:hypothetical protein
VLAVLSFKKGNMTIDKILLDVRIFRPCSYAQARRYLKSLKIKQVGCRQRPANYPEDSSKKILAHLGFTDSPAPESANGSSRHDDTKIVGLKKLQSVRATKKIRRVKC